MNKTTVLRNQLVFREVNNRIADITAQQREGEAEFLCECGRGESSSAIGLDLTAYEAFVREMPSSSSQVVTLLRKWTALSSLATATSWSSLWRTSGGRPNVCGRAAAGRVVGETLIDETGMWERAADAAGAPRFTVIGVLGGLIVREEHHSEVWRTLGVPHPASSWTLDDLYLDALPCIEALRGLGLRVCAVGNTPQETEELLVGVVDVLGSSERWGVAKPSAGSSRESSMRSDLPQTRSPMSETGWTTTSAPHGRLG
jgi:hypothetical protein